MQKLTVQPFQLAAADHPAAFQATVQQLGEVLQVRPVFSDSRDEVYWGQQCRDAGGWEWSPVDVCFSGWVWDAGMLRAYPQAVVALDAKRLEVFCSSAVRVTQLNDDVLSAAIAAATQLPQLWASSLALQSDQHAGAAWPWDELRIDTVEVSQLLRLPNPAGEGAPRKLVCGDLHIGTDTAKVRPHACHTPHADA